MAEVNHERAGAAAGVRQVRLFKRLESDINALQEEINGFLREPGVRLVSVSGNIAPQSETDGKRLGGDGYTPSDVLVIVVYEKG